MDRSMGFEVRMRFRAGHEALDRRLQPSATGTAISGGLAVGGVQTRRSSLPMAFRMARLGA